MGLLSGKAVLITGSGSGLGRAAAIYFAGEGASVIVNGRNGQQAEEVARMINAEGGKAIAVQADVSIEADVDRLFRTAIEAFGAVDILVNNAAVFESGLVEETTLEAWNYQLSNNLTSAFLMTKACLPMMRKQNYGRIINITSALSANGAGGFAAYSASKAGLESLTRTTADEQSDFDILVNMFDPGTVKSGMHATGKDPLSVAPDLLALAALPRKGASGALFVSGQKQTG